MRTDIIAVPPMSGSRKMVISRRSLLSLLAAGGSRVLAQAPRGMASRGVKPAPRAKFSGVPFPARLTDVAREAGLKHVVVSGHPDRCDYITETMSCGAAFFDYDDEAGSTFSSRPDRVSEIRRPTRRTVSTRTTAMEHSRMSRRKPGCFTQAIRMVSQSETTTTTVSRTYLSPGGRIICCIETTATAHSPM